MFDSVENGCKLLRKIGAKGTAEGQLNNLMGIAVDRQNNILVANQYNHRVQIFKADGSFLHSFGKQGKGIFEVSFTLE